MAASPGEGDVPAADESATREARGQYILLIDDEDTILDVLVTLLHDEEGYVVFAARSGAEALRIAPESAPAFVLLDVTLHGENAEEVVQALRARPGWNAVTLVICSAIPRLHEVARELGAQEQLAKPFDLDELLAVVERYGPPPPRASP
jgi:DNA-binding response OmpR family regulator